MSIQPVPPPAGDPIPSLPALPGCGQPATARLELYADITYRSLDGSIYLCDDHAPVTVAAATAFHEATGLTPFRVPTGPGKRCGDGFDFLSMRPLDAPVTEAEVDAAARRVLALTSASQIGTGVPTSEHRTRWQQLPGGPIEVRCSCGKWGGTAPSVEVAERDAAQHRAEHAAVTS